MIYKFNNFIPVVDPTSFVHPQAVVTGNVIIGKHVYIGARAAIRGDGDRSSSKMAVMYRKIVPFICFPE